MQKQSITSQQHFSFLMPFLSHQHLILLLNVQLHSKELYSKSKTLTFTITIVSIHLMQEFMEEYFHAQASCVIHLSINLRSHTTLLTEQVWSILNKVDMHSLREWNLLKTLLMQKQACCTLKQMHILIWMTVNWRIMKHH